MVSGLSIVIYLGLAVCLSAALAQDEPIPSAQSREVDKPAHFQVWRSITLGSYKGVDAYRDALDVAKIKIGDSADKILGRPAFPYARTKTGVELAVHSAADLGVESDQASLAEIYQRARQAGLELCPAEVGPQLRLGRSSDICRMTARPCSDHIEPEVTMSPRHRMRLTSQASASPFAVEEGARQ
jgi:hypothetical protein